jgi:hypothetical protein
MKISNLKRWGMGGALVGALALGGGCGTMDSMRGEQTWTMSTTDKIPSAVGKVKVAKTKEGNTKVKVEVAHLAQPDAAFDHASTYVVWLKPQSGAAQNVGVLNVGKDLKGELETQTAFKNFEVLVTAERSANVMTPAGQSVMDTRVVVPT